MKAVYYVGDKQMEMREIPIPPKADESVKIDACVCVGCRRLSGQDRTPGSADDYGL